MATPPRSPTPSRYSPAVLDAIARGRVGHSHDQSLASKAILDQAAIVALLRTAGVSAPTLISRSAVVREDFAEVCYIFNPGEAQNPTSRLNIRIAQAKENSDQALTMLKEYLSGFQEDITKSVKPTGKPYGDCSLQTAYNVFWTHSRHVVDISCSATKPGIQVLNSIAAAFDQALTKADVTPKNLVYPVPKLSTPGPVSATQGKSFLIKLASVTDLDPVTFFRVGKTGTILEVRPSTSDGTFELIPKGTNSSKVTIVVAHKQYLTVGTAEIQINVTPVAKRGG